MVTDGTLRILRVDPVIGRHFTKQDDSPGAADTVMLMHSFWQRKFGGDPAAVGKSMTIDGKPYQIIGVLPERFQFLDRKPQVLLPFQFDRTKIFAANFSYQGLARLKPGVTIEQANADVARMLPLIVERFPMPKGFTPQMFADAKLGPKVRPLSVDVIGDIGQMLWILLGTVGLVLLIACANVANLFLVRAEGRQQELAIHAALGASWRRLTWELLSESLTLAAVGGAVGLVLAYGALQALKTIAPDGLPRLSEITLDPIVVLFTVGISIVAGLLFGSIPVLKFARPHLSAALKEGGRLSSAGRERHRARNTLVVAEIALAVILLVASGLMIRTFQAMQKVEPGFTKPEEVLTLRVAIPESLIKDEVQTARTFEQMVRRIEQVPGVTSVGLSSSITMDGYDSNDPIFVEDFPTPEGRIPTIRRFKWIGENYFKTMGQSVMAGRDITWNDVFTAAKVVVVSENFAREYWKDPAVALGKRVRVNPAGDWRTIVGIVADARDDGVTRPAPTIVHWPMVVDKMWTDEMTVQPYDGLRHPDRPRRLPDAPQGSAAGGLGGQFRGAGCVGTDTRRDPRRVNGADVLRARHAQHRGWCGAVTGDCRHLRGDFLHCDPAHTRDRHPDRAGSRAWRRQHPLPAPWDGADGSRDRARHRRRRRTDPADGRDALWRERARLGHLRCRDGESRGDRSGGQLSARDARGTNGPGDRSPLRLITALIRAHVPRATCDVRRATCRVRARADTPSHPSAPLAPSAPLRTPPHPSAPLSLFLLEHPCRHDTLILNVCALDGIQQRSLQLTRQPQKRFLINDEALAAVR